MPSANGIEANAAGVAEELQTVGDFLRYAVSRFAEAKLMHGHGASTAIDEAAFLILETLHLPIDDINPWLAARLTRPERLELAKRIERRASERLPSSYITGRAYIQGEAFRVDERVIVPRSFIGEILFSEGLAALIDDPQSVERVLDLCTGSGCLAILAARRFPMARIDATDISPDALAVARQNVEEKNLNERISLFEGDLFKPVKDRRYDLILANPPYVDAEAMAALPAEYRHEPVLALAGGADGLDIVRRILAEASAHLEPQGGLLCEIGRGRERLEAQYPQIEFLWLDTEESEGEVFWLTREQLGELD